MIWFGEHKQVDRHFAGLGTPARDHRMFQHVAKCDRCRARYRTYATLEMLVPGGDDQARDRMARGIFERARRRTFVAVGLGLAVACAALVLVVGKPGPGPNPDGFQTRGGTTASGPGQPSLAIFRLAGDGVTRSQRAGSTMRAGEPLAFSFTNPPAGGYSNLMVFAVDDRRQVYWFWPAWTNPADDPSSIIVSPGDEPMELGESVRHPLAPGRLTIYGLFSAAPHHVREVEAVLARGPRTLESLESLGGFVWSEALDVKP